MGPGTRWGVGGSTCDGLDCSIAELGQPGEPHVGRGPPLLAARMVRHPPAPAATRHCLRDLVSGHVAPDAGSAQRWE
jgi:hypothetical protein